ncbi:MAG: hypothetical protein M1813_005396 [Trichoglossum hirsutum]|nr:MAG: hypothetical protein M1813_005396 [Trichoglossum hirsutum]
MDIENRDIEAWIEDQALEQTHKRLLMEPDASEGSESGQKRRRLQDPTALNRRLTLVCPSSQEDLSERSSRSRKSSPIRSAADLESAVPPIRKCEINPANEAELPEGVRRLRERVKAYKNLRGVIPSCIKSELTSVLGSDFEDPFYISTSIDRRTRETWLRYWEEIQLIRESAQLCSDEDKPEPSWGEEVVRPLLNLGIKFVQGLASDWCYNSIILLISFTAPFKALLVTGIITLLISSTQSFKALLVTGVITLLISSTQSFKALLVTGVITLLVTFTQSFKALLVTGVIILLITFTQSFKALLATGVIILLITFTQSFKALIVTGVITLLISSTQSIRALLVTDAIILLIDSPITVRAENLTTATISPPHLVPKDARGNPLEPKKVDYGMFLVLNPDGSKLVKGKLQCLDPTERSVNLTMAGYVRNKPLVMFMELKKANSESDPVVQLGVCASALLRRLTLLSRTKLMDLLPLPVLQVVGHDWKVYYLHYADCGDVMLRGPDRIGSTLESESIFQIIRVLGVVADYAVDEYWPWYKENIL